MHEWNVGQKSGNKELMEAEAKIVMSIIGIVTWLIVGAVAVGLWPNAWTIGIFLGPIALAFASLIIFYIVDGLICLYRKWQARIKNG